MNKFLGSKVCGPWGNPWVSCAPMEPAEYSGNSPIEALQAYFDTVSYLKIISEWIPPNKSWTPKRIFFLLSKAVASKNLGDHLNQVFSDKDKMKEVGYSKRKSFPKSFNSPSGIRMS